MRVDKNLLQLLRQQLAGELVAIIDGWDQTEAAALLGLRQPDVSLLRAGKLARFSVARLLGLIASRGYHVELTLKPAFAPPASLRQKPTISVKRYDRFGRRATSAATDAEASADIAESQ